jgi:hypothetical protein
MTRDPCHDTCHVTRGDVSCDIHPLPIGVSCHVVTSPRQRRIGVNCQKTRVEDRRMGAADKLSVLCPDTSAASVTEGCVSLREREVSESD